MSSELRYVPAKGVDEKPAPKKECSVPGELIINTPVVVFPKSGVLRLLISLSKERRK